ncbi:translation initiation factor IF-2 subunit gamma [Nanoarchaeota archaeon]
MSKKTKDEPAQPEVNIGLIGHVDHGKTTLTERLSGKWTDTHSEELKRGITIRLGYADAVLRKCSKCKGTNAFTVNEKCERCEGESKILRTISLVDAPGHESLMATMLSGATIMDGALLLISANEECPQPQTREHIVALQIMGINKVIVIQNKIDLVSEEQAMNNYKQIQEFLKDTPYKDSPIIPVSAQKKVNVDAVIEAIEKHIPTPKRDPKKEPLMLVARSFDINKPGSVVDKLVGGVLGGALIQGVLKIDEEIEIKPGRKIEKHGKTTWHPITAIITGLKTGSADVKEVGPGGSIGVLTSLDPSVVKSDSLAGSVVGHKDKLPQVWDELILETHLLERVVGAKEDLIVEPIKLGEPLMLNVNSAATVGMVDKLGKNEFHCKLRLPVCADPGARVTISRRVGNRFRLIGYGVIKE